MMSHMADGVVKQGETEREREKSVTRKRIKRK
jgi:hypothetical protein